MREVCILDCDSPSYPPDDDERRQCGCALCLADLRKKMADIPTRLTGRIIKISKTGWGFISSKEIEFTRIFFHWTVLTQDTLGFKELKIGMNVEFTPIKIPIKGWRAVHVRVIPKETKDEEKRTGDSDSENTPQEVPVTE